MPSHWTERKSAHPYLQSVWRSQTQGQESIVVGAKSTWDIIVIACGESLRVQLSAPHKYPQAMDVGLGNDINYFTGLKFAPGIYVPDAVKYFTKDNNTINLAIHEDTVIISTATLPIPAYDTAEQFTEAALNMGILLHNKVIDQTLAGPNATILAPRTIQRLFLRKIGMSKAQVQQLNRAEYAASLMNSGVPPAQVAAIAGYADQAHMTRVFKVLFGKTPRKLDEGYRNAND